MWHWGKRRGLILMRILIYGAGVIGSLYAALFAEAGYDTNIYARGKRLEALIFCENKRVNCHHGK